MGATQGEASFCSNEKIGRGLGDHFLAARSRIQRLASGADEMGRDAPVMIAINRRTKGTVMNKI